MNKPIQTYKPALKDFIIGIVGVIVVVAALVFLIYENLSGSVQVSPDNKSLITTGYIVLVVLLLFFLAMIAWYRHKERFYLYNDGVQVNRDAVIPYKSIADVYLFLSGKDTGTSYNNLAFRTGENERWHTISATYLGRLDVFLGQYIPKRFEAVDNAIQRGESVTFHYFPKKKNTSASGALSFLRKKDATMTLSPDALSIGNTSYSYKNLKPLFMNGDKFEIKTRGDDTILSIGYKDVMSFDVFREAYNRKVMSGSEQ